MDVEICASLASNGEVATACIKDGPSKEADDSAESKVCDDTGCSDEASQNSGITNGCPDTSAVAEDDTAGPVNGTSDEGAAEVGLVDKPSSDTDAISTVEDGSKGNSEALECGDSQQDSIVDDDAEKTEASEPSEDLPLPDAKGSDSVKNKETNSEDSTPSTPRRTMKKKSKKVSKLSIMHAIAERLSGQSKGDSKGASRAESKGDGESNASDSTSEVTEERLTHDSKDSSEADPKPASPARESGSSKKSGNTCAVCSAVKGLRYQVLYQGRTQFLCSDVCFKAFRSKQKLAPKKPPERDRCAVCQKEHADSTGFYSSFGPCKTLCSADCLEKHQKSQRPKRTCVQCKQSVEAADLKGTSFLVWETMEFCAEECLRKYQSTHGSHCSHCRTAVSQLSLGKYCVRFGADIRQFCSGKCLEEFKRGLKVCCLCQKDLSKQTEGFLAPVGDKGHFKDFCSQQCLDRYERMNAFNAANLVAHKCAACEAETTTKYQVEFNEGSHRLCSDACVSKFRYANKIKTVVCENCHKLFDNTACPPHSLYYDNACQQFCTKACVNLFVLSHRKIVPCSWCKVKKYNFDMIEQVEINSPSHLFCSINCLNLFRVNHNATSSRVIRCDNCTKMMPAQYHLTMSDATIRNFCSYKCVITFQNQFKNLPLLTTTSPTVTQATMGKSQVAAGTSSNTPVISNIRSLAPLVKPGGQPVIPTSMQSASEMKSVSVPSSLRPPPTLTAMPKVVSAPVLTQANSVTDVAPKVVAQAPSIAASASAPAVTVTVPPPATLKPSVLKDIASVAPTPGQAEREVIIQLPFPKLLRNKSVLCRPTMVSKAAFCRPMGCHKEMQTEAEAQTGSESGPVRLIPVPVPIYVPVPMHMFSHAVPSPMPIPIPVPVPIFLPTTRDTTEQILETLKEIKEQMKDDKFDEVLLTIARSLVEASSSKTSPPEQTDDPPETRPRKRAASEEADDDISSKKTKVSDDEMETSACSVATEDTVVRTHESLDPAAAASSWQDWVQKKNSELEKGSLSGKRQLKLFKTNLLSMTPEELNYALCLFVKEVRQPDNTPPSPCHIYLQCLGIQQYLHEQGRQDNIFADPQYEMFTGCFHSIFSQASSPDRELREHVREEVLWRAKQLGDHSPLVLLNTLMYFNVKYFRLHTVEQHLQLSLADVTEQEEEGPEGQSFKILRSTVGRQEKESDHGCCDQPENVENPQRCPVKLYELYLSKCPEAARSKQGAYYMLPDRACSVESSVWYSCNPLGKDVISRMLTRFSVVEEVKELSSKLFAQA